MLCHIRNGWYEGIIYLLTIRVADLTGIDISIFVYFHMPLVSRTDLAKNMHKIKVNVSVSAAITTTALPEYDACQRTLVSALWWLHCSNRHTFADVINQVLADSANTSGISSFDLTDTLLWWLARKWISSFVFTIVQKCVPVFALWHTLFLSVIKTLLPARPLLLCEKPL